MGEYLEDFQASHHVLTADTLLRNGAVSRLVLLRKRMIFRLFGGRLAVFAAFFQSLIPTIGKAKLRGFEHRTTGLEQRKIGCFARAEGGGKYFARFLIGNYLRFLGVSLFLARVVASLFFFGRSQGHSVASIKTISKSISL